MHATTAFSAHESYHFLYASDGLYLQTQCKLVDACEETVSNYGLVEIVTTFFWRYD